jgi:hypothetical protein
MENKKNGFFIASFGINGEMEGIDHWAIDKLSSKWLEICSQYLAFHGASFDAPWSGDLSHIQTKFTAASGAALVTFSAMGKLVASIALASGNAQTTESSVLKMFVNSLRGVELVRAASISLEPFQGVFEIKERPLMVVVPWGDPKTTEQDNALVRELSIHTAGAFFLRERD